LLDLAEVTGKRIVSTRLHGNVTIREGTHRALEVMSRFAANPKWLIYCTHDVALRDEPGARLLEHPAGSFCLLSPRGVPESFAKKSTWALAPWSSVCQDEDAARKTFRHDR